MNVNRLAALFLLVGTLAAISPLYAREKDKGESGRLLTGRVTDKQGNGLTDAVVYLSNTRTRTVKTYIVGPGGNYRFPELSPNIDYEVYAQYKNHKSDTKTVSQFDSRPQVNIDLRIDMK
jgi:Carboxypeptidase regulatory-like domain